MPEPHNTRGEVSDTDVRSPASDDGTSTPPASEPDRAQSGQDDADQVADASGSEPHRDADSAPSESAGADSQAKTVTDDDTDDAPETDVSGGPAAAESTENADTEAGLSSAGGPPPAEMSVSGVLPTARPGPVGESAQRPEAETALAETSTTDEGEHSAEEGAEPEADAEQEADPEHPTDADGAGNSAAEGSDTDEAVDVEPGSVEPGSAAETVSEAPDSDPPGSDPDAESGQVPEGEQDAGEPDEPVQEDVSTSTATAAFPTSDSGNRAGSPDSTNGDEGRVGPASQPTGPGTGDAPTPSAVDTGASAETAAEEQPHAAELFPSVDADVEQPEPDPLGPPADVETTGPDLALGSTQQFSRISLPEAETERTQQLRAIADTGPVSRVAPPESSTEQTSRIDLGGLLRTPVPDADSGSATEHIPVVQPGSAAETQQFARPDFDESRSARPEDFLGVSDRESQGWTGGDGEFSNNGSSASAGQPPSDEGRAPRKRRRGPVIAVAAAVVVLLGVGVAVGPKITDMASGVEDPPPPVHLDPQIGPLDDNAALPQQSGVTQQLSGALNSPAVGELSGTVLDARTGQTVWQQQGDRPLIPASNGKLFTVSAALLALDHEQRFSTKIVRGSTPGSVVLVGGGDPTLSRLSAGQESVYPGAARADDLVEQVNAATGGDVSSVQVDTSRYTGPSMAPGWLPEDVEGGSVAPVEPVMLDGDRQDPAEDTSPRTDQPALGAARHVADQLGTTQVSEGTAPPDAEVLGEVHSPTVRELSETVLQHSDNVLAEALGREVAISTGNEPSFAGATRAVDQVLQRNGFALGPTKMVDGSGLSLDDRASSTALAGLFAKATEPPGPNGQLTPQAAKLRALLPGLPVAGGSGSLATRFQDGEGRGWVRAKTGTLDGANSLAGTVLTEDGRLLVFTLLSNGTSSVEARPALDRIAAKLSGCGCD